MPQYREQELLPRPQHIILLLVRKHLCADDGHARIERKHVLRYRCLRGDGGARIFSTSKRRRVATTPLTVYRDDVGDLNDWILFGRREMTFAAGTQYRTKGCASGDLHPHQFVRDHVVRVDVDFELTVRLLL